MRNTAKVIKKQENVLQTENVKNIKNIKTMTWKEETRILRADYGKWVTEDDINFAIEVKIAPSESPDNWWEVDHLPPVPDNNNNKEETKDE